MKTVIDYCQTILEKECRVGRAGLSAAESECYVLYRFVCEFENGGLSGLLYNISPDWDYLTALAEVLRRKEERELASLMESARRIVASGPDDFRGTWSEWLALADPEHALQGIDGALFPKYSVIWKLLEDAFPKKG